MIVIIFAADCAINMETNSDAHVSFPPSLFFPWNGFIVNTRKKSAQEERHTQCLALVLAAGSVSSLYSDTEVERRLTTARLDGYLRGRIQRRYDVVREALHACGLMRPTHNALRMDRASLGRVLSCMRADGGVARGVVLWIDDGITHGTAESLASQTVRYLALLEAVLLLHGTLLVTQVADVMLRLFDKSVDGLRASIVTGFASLCTLNICNSINEDDGGKEQQQQQRRQDNGGDDDYHVGTIIMREFQTHWIPMGQLSKTLIRTFVRRITQVVTKPYKAPFVTAMCTLLADPAVETAVADDCKLATLVLQLKQDMYHLF